MPFVRIDYPAGKDKGYREALSDAVATALTESLHIPSNDRFQVLTEHSRGAIVADQRHLEIDGSDQTIVVQAFINAGRSTEQKCSFYKATASHISQLTGTRKEDIIISIVEVRGENWSFGNGEAQYA